MKLSEWYRKNNWHTHANVPVYNFHSHYIVSGYCGRIFQRNMNGGQFIACFKIKLRTHDNPNPNNL